MRMVLCIVLVGCGTSTNPYLGAPTGSGVNCGRACTHAIECLQQPQALQQCVEACNANPNVMAGVEQATCEQILQAAANYGGATNQGGTNQGGCSADCTGCWHDGSSCTAYNLGMQCEACCCR